MNYGGYLEHDVEPLPAIRMRGKNKRNDQRCVLKQFLENMGYTLFSVNLDKSNHYLYSMLLLVGYWLIFFH